MRASTTEWLPYGLALVSILLSSFAQICLKLLMRGRAISVHLAGQPLLYIGFLAYGLSAVLWLGVLSRLPLVIAYPLVSINFVLVAIAGNLVLHESFSWSMILGLFLIMAGIVVIVRH